MAADPGVFVTRRMSREVGGCNACTRHYHASGCHNHEVYMIELRGVSVRVCEACKVELQRQLAEKGEGVK